MKILELRFKNLNSLYGEWYIDFTHPDYKANGRGFKFIEWMMRHRGKHDE